MYDVFCNCGLFANGTIMTDIRSSSSATRKPRISQRERSSIARAKMIDAAITLICERGFALTTVAEIAAQAGMTRGAIQHHFLGRDELVLAILLEVETRIRHSFEQILVEPERDSRSRIERLIDELGEIGRSSAYLAVMDIWISTRAEPGLRDAVRESVLRSSASYRQLWQRAFASDVPSEIVSDCRRVVVSILRGAVISRIFVSEPKSYAATLDTLKRMVVAFMKDHGQH